MRDPQTGQPFPNNQIPVSRFGQFARNLLANESLYPRANVTARAHRFPQQLPRPVGVERGDQPVRRQGRLERLRQDKLFVRYSRQTHEPRPRRR